MKKEKMVFTAVLAVFLVSSGLLAKTFYVYRQEKQAYDRLAGEAVRVLPGTGDDSSKNDDMAAGDGRLSDGGNSDDADQEDTDQENVDFNRLLVIDFEILQSKNPEIIAWLDVPGTGISYPLTQSKDNSYYLNHNANGGKSSSGCIFMDYRNQADLSDDNTVIYGHNMRNGSMFGGLKRFHEAAYFKKHPYVDLYLPEGRIRFRIYSCYEVTADEEHFPVKFADGQEQEAYLTSAVGHSYYQTGVTPNGGEHTLMLSTCTGRGYGSRWVVHAVEE